MLAPFDYAALDQSASNVRIRLDSTCVDVRNAPGKVLVAYMRAGAMYRVEASHVVLACFHMVIPHLMPELATEQRAALAQNVKTPICYTSVVVRNWRPWVALKISSIAAPMSFHSGVSLDFPVSLGGYRHPRDPSEPMALHLVHVAGAPNRGLTAREQFHIGQRALMQTTFADFEARIATSSIACWARVASPSARDIAAITVNRWPHGYGYVELVVRWRRLWKGARARTFDGGPCGDRQLGCGRRCLCAPCDRPGGAGGARRSGKSPTLGKNSTNAIGGQRKGFFEFRTGMVQLLLGACLVVFAVCYSQSGAASIPSEILFRYGAMYSQALERQEYWRLVTYGFLHANPVHLLVNMLCLVL